MKYEKGAAVKNFTKSVLFIKFFTLIIVVLCYTASYAEDLQAESVKVKLHNSEEILTLKTKIPPSWSRNPDFGGVVYQPQNYADYFYPPILQYETSCGGSCAPQDIPNNIENRIKGIKNTLARPNINTGDPELDAIRAYVEILVEEKYAEDGWIIAAAVSYPEELSSALYIPKIVVHSFRHHQGDRFFVQTTARAQLTQKEEFLALFLEVCKQTDY